MGLQAGSFLGQYEIWSVRTAGPTGELYTARDGDSTATVAIIPLAAAPMTDPKRHQRLLDQAAAATTLSHATIATLLDVAESDGQYYGIYENVDGGSLRALLGRRHLSPRRTVGLAIDVATAVAEAHAMAVQHGWLTLDAVIVARNGGVKVLGFGLCPTGRGDRLADVTALGALLFEMLHGRPPSERDQKAISPPSSGATLRADAGEQIPAELHALVSRALAGTGSADALAAELRAVAAILDVRGEVKHAAAPPPRRTWLSRFGRGRGER